MERFGAHQGRQLYLERPGAYEGGQLYKCSDKYLYQAKITGHTQNM
jgi:hypothetical protein